MCYPAIHCLYKASLYVQICLKSERSSFSGCYKDLNSFIHFLNRLSNLRSLRGWSPNDTGQSSSWVPVWESWGSHRHQHNQHLTVNCKLHYYPILKMHLILYLTYLWLLPLGALIYFICQRETLSEQLIDIGRLFQTVSALPELCPIDFH